MVFDISSVKLAGVDDEIIAEDYELTRVGREPVRERILQRLSKEPIFASNKDAALNMLTSRSIPYNSSGTSKLII